jgi:RHS repeat-associated protein
VRQKFGGGHERDDETNLDFMQARYYSSGQGRFTSVDPENYQAMRDLDNPQSWNAYAYVNNNPLTRVDPNGKGILSRIWNRIRWGVNGEDSDVQAVEQSRRQFLYDNSFIKDAQGNWQHQDFSNLDRDGVWSAYYALQDRIADSNQYHLTADEIANALPSVGGLKSITESARLGREGEASSGLVKNTQRIPSETGTAKYRIPDGLTDNTLSEVKNVAKQRYTKQLQDFAAYAKQSGRTFELYVRPTTRLSPALQEQIRSGNIILKFLP